MTRVSQALFFHRSRSRALLAALVATAQFAVAAFAPALDAREGLGAPAHVESQGTRLHLAHNPDNCAACLAQTLVGVATPSARALPDVAATPSEFQPVAPSPIARVDWRPDAPRAPPAPSAARSTS